MLAIGVSCAIAAAVVLPQVPLRVGVYPYRSYRSSAAWQTLDFGVGQFIVSVPLFVLAGSGANDLIGGVRLAQTLLGPLNLAFAATTTNIVADGATHGDYRQASAIIARAGVPASGSGSSRPPVSRSSSVSSGSAAGLLQVSNVRTSCSGSSWSARRRS